MEERIKTLEKEVKRLNRDLNLLMYFFGPAVVIIVKVVTL